MGRGQFILEFIIFISIAVFIGLAYLAVSSRMLVDVSEEQRAAALNDVGYGVQDELILAATVEDGYQRTLVIPQKADRFTYELSNDNDTLTLTSGPLTVTYDLPAISGALQKGSNIVTKDGRITVVPG